MPVAFQVDQDHQGTPEHSWRTWAGLRDCPPLELPPVGRALIVAPHPDDEILGAGGLIQQLARRGWEVELVGVSDGERSHPPSIIDPADLGALRAEESNLALERLGLPHLPRRRLHLPDGQVAAYEKDLVESIVLRPGDLCVTSWRGDGHPDHEACGRAGAAAAAAAGATLIEYLVWAWHWARPAESSVPWEAARRVTLERRDAARKRFATLAFRSQVAPLRGEAAVLPQEVLRRAWRPFEVYLT
jgi:LmbE family N-acetylglucosaminyl deacetylase